MPASRYYTARWLLPVSQPPIDGGWFEVVDHVIRAVGRGAAPGVVTDLGDVAVLPGLVNAHTHLELSWMEGRVPPSASMNDWIATLIGERRRGPAGGHDEEVEAARRAIAAMRATGTVLVGDISNTLLSPRILAEAGLGGVVFHEVLGFNHPDPSGAVRSAWERLEHEKLFAALTPRVVCTVVAHAPYSVSPALFAAIAAQANELPLSIHLAESSEEIEFLRTGGGPIRATLERLGVWDDTWRAPGSDPVQYIADLGYLRPGTLVVHGVHLTEDALTELRRADAVVVTCPRSNLWVGAGSPRLSRFYAAGVPIAIGTDSLASVATLNLFDELGEMRRLAPEVTAATLLNSATRVGARALGFGTAYGTIEPGKRASLVAVGIPSGERDVEEYLVSGVADSAVNSLSL